MDRIRCVPINNVYNIKGWITDNRKRKTKFLIWRGDKYVKLLFHDAREKHVLENSDGPEIRKYEVRSVREKMKLYKAAEHEVTVAEIPHTL